MLCALVLCCVVMCCDVFLSLFALCCVQARDVTPEATRAVIQKEAPGLVTAMLHATLNRLPAAMLSRAVCGIRNRTYALSLTPHNYWFPALRLSAHRLVLCDRLIVNLPGSPKAVVEYLGILLPTVAHGIKLLQNPNDTH
jgi:molybdopterin adenylyltransferase